MLAVCEERGSFDRVIRAGTHTVGHNSVATFEGSRKRERVSESRARGTAQPTDPLRGIPRRVFRRGRMSTAKQAFGWEVI
ncbi:MAG: hypothetical protein J07HQW2_01229 [Haloquadratum walsbyi J07HQW2]|uniref:Uncharacterized protein n=1 Tax=Haloquadratum walsbyi J07HQW2 TaxID=1238425 RepID=U1PM51_9EURY|nr:MAG: hypothetical protein J07HQW2_01229 [Haloquadratum walsbyi J07HQW2]